MIVFSLSFCAVHLHTFSFFAILLLMVILTTIEINVEPRFGVKNAVTTAITFILLLLHYRRYRAPQLFLCNPHVIKQKLGSNSLKLMSEFIVVCASAA